MAELPPPPDAAPDVAVVTMVHKVKSKLGYTEINAPVAIQDDKVNIFIVCRGPSSLMCSRNISQCGGCPLKCSESLTTNFEGDRKLYVASKFYAHSKSAPFRSLSLYRAVLREGSKRSLSGVNVEL